MPTPYQNVLVSGGIAYWDGMIWYTCMERDHPPIQWEIEYWATLSKPPNHCANCDALRAKIFDMQRLINDLVHG